MMILKLFTILWLILGLSAGLHAIFLKNNELSNRNFSAKIEEPLDCILALLNIIISSFLGIISWAYIIKENNNSLEVIKSSENKHYFLTDSEKVILKKYSQNKVS